MRLTASFVNEDGSKVEAPLDIHPDKGWYETDIKNGDNDTSLQYYTAFPKAEQCPNMGLIDEDVLLRKVIDDDWTFMGEELNWAMDGGHYRSDGSIVYQNEAQAYKRIWYNSNVLGVEHMMVVTNEYCIVFPTTGNIERQTSIPSKFGYINIPYKTTVYDQFDKCTIHITKSKLTDPLNGNKLLEPILLAHTHPDKEIIDFSDIDFQSQIFPFCPMYVFSGTNNEYYNYPIHFISMGEGSGKSLHPSNNISKIGF